MNKILISSFLSFVIAFSLAWYFRGSIAKKDMYSYKLDIAEQTKSMAKSYLDKISKIRSQNDLILNAKDIAIQESKSKTKSILEDLNQAQQRAGEYDEKYRACLESALDDDSADSLYESLQRIRDPHTS